MKHTILFTYQDKVMDVMNISNFGMSKSLTDSTSIKVARMLKMKDGQSKIAILTNSSKARGIAWLKNMYGTLDTRGQKIDSHSLWSNGKVRNLNICATDLNHVLGSSPKRLTITELSPAFTLDWNGDGFHFSSFSG
jgi:hypothetical protein